MKPIVPLFYYPLKTLFVDDNIDLLKVYHHLNLPNKIETEDDPEKAIQKLNENTNQTCIFNDITDANYMDALQANDEAVISFAFDNIKALINDADKYDKYGIVVTDYNMPVINGIELCHKITDLNMIKILITGEYNPLNAIDALNDKTIDYYLQKGQGNTSEQLLKSVRQLELNYFKDITQNFFNLACHKFEFLADIAFANIINDFINNNNITEYYLLNNSGCFLMGNKTDKYVLNIYTDHDLDTFCDMYAHLDQAIVQKIKQRELIPNFELSDGGDIAHDFYPCIKADKYYYNFSKLENNNFLNI